MESERVENKFCGGLRKPAPKMKYTFHGIPIEFTDSVEQTPEEVFGSVYFVEEIANQDRRTSPGGELNP